MAVYNGTNKVNFPGISKIYVGTQLVYSSEGPTPPGTETWVFNDNITVNTINFTVHFISNNTTYTEIRCSSSGTRAYMYYYQNKATFVTVATIRLLTQTTTWENTAYKTIELSEPATGDLLTFLQANATKQ